MARDDAIELLEDVDDLPDSDYCPCRPDTWRLANQTEDQIIAALDASLIVEDILTGSEWPMKFYISSEMLLLAGIILDGPEELLGFIWPRVGRGKCISRRNLRKVLLALSENSGVSLCRQRIRKALDDFFGEGGEKVVLKRKNTL